MTDQVEMDRAVAKLIQSNEDHWISLEHLKRELVDRYWITFQNTHAEILSLVEAGRAEIEYFSQGVYANGEELSMDCCTYFIEKRADLLPAPLHNPPSTSSTTANMQPQHNVTVVQPQQNDLHNNDLKLPRITIPVFDGNYYNWPSFHDLFKSLIHDKVNIPNVQKLQYLKSNLKGEAEQLIRHFQCTNNNYQSAWEMLTNRYDNQRVHITNQLNILFNQPKITIESACNIKRLLDTTTECIFNLQNLNVSTDGWDPIFVHFLTQRLPLESHTLWEQTLQGTKEFPDFGKLSAFLEMRYRTLEAVSTNHFKQSHPSSYLNNKQQHKNVHSLTFSNTLTSCCLCSQSHSIRQCSRFLSMDVQTRSKSAREKSLCINCLSANHRASRCRSNRRCDHCKKPHHTLLHFPISPSRPPSSSVSTTSVPAAGPAINSNMTTPQNSLNLNTFYLNETRNYQVLLATALVRITTDSGRELVVRALLDQGSQVSFITESARQLLCLKKTPIRAEVSGIGATPSLISEGQASFVINAHFQNKLNLRMNALIMKSLTSILPPIATSSGPWDHTEGLVLADPHFYQPQKIDLLLGADVYSSILMDGLLRGIEGTPLAQKTRLGWVLSGSVANCSPAEVASHISITSLAGQVSIDDQLKRFWEIEEFQTSRTLTKDEQLCEEIFNSTVEQQPDGRIVTKLPFREEFNNELFLGHSKALAFTRLFQLEKTLRRKSHLRIQYNQCIQEYLNLDHMELVLNSEIDLVCSSNPLKVNGCYLPHHAVVKESSSSTEVRVVFDPSRPTGSGFSLNQCLLIGPRLQEDLFSILVRFRKHYIAITADITKMYRQILLDETHRDYHRILWRFNENEPIQEYRMKRVIFGVSSAPHTAVKTIQYLAGLYKNKYPLAADVLMNDFYVDDCVSGADSVEIAILMKQQIKDIL